MAEREMTADQLAEYNSKHGADPELEKKSYKNDECFINTPWLDHKTIENEVSEKMKSMIAETKKELERINANFSTR